MTDLSVKVLLKQVYAAHVSKVKFLEEEVDGFKNKLLEADRKLNEYGSECRRCVELEEAFKSCKAALNEQTKWFENLGQKFSVFSSSESANVSKKALGPAATDISSGLNLSGMTTEKSTFIKQNFFKNLMSLNCDESKDSLDLCSVPFPANLVSDYSTLNQDSLILAPDTVDLDVECKQKVKSHKDFDISINKVNTATDKTSDSNNSALKDRNSADVKEDPHVTRLQKKRQISNSADSEKTAKKISKANETLIPKTSVVIEDIKCKEKEPSGQDLGEKLKEQIVDKNIGTKQNVKNNGASKCTSSEDMQNGQESSIVKTKIRKPNIEICKDVTIVPEDKNLHDITQKCQSKVTQNSSYQVSPSLLPVNNKKNKVLQPAQSENEDINDFQTPIINKKSPENDGAWTACDKKKIKKAQNIKLKTTSKFKMSLDSLPPNYKKPTYRQMKLSRSIFQPKSSTSTAANIEKNTVNNESASLSETPKISGGSTGIDFDATCIPDNFAYNTGSSKSGIKNGITSDGENSNDNSILLIGDENFDDSADSSPILKDAKQKVLGKLSSSKLEEEKFEDFLTNCKTGVTTNSFDRLPKKEEPNYKYKEETVRKKADRKQLNAYDCKECEQYFSELGLSDEEKRERLKKCSRHRSKFAPPPTPEHFWELEFPDTQECKARGYMNKTQKGSLKSHRRRPL